MMNNYVLIVLALFVSNCLSAASPKEATYSEDLAISNLRLEYLDNPTGLHETLPRFSWILSSDRRGAKQTAYQITAISDSKILWDSGKVLSSKTAQIAYKGKALESSMSCIWKVSVWDENGDVINSDTAQWSMGLLHENDWQADWIGLPMEKPKQGEFPASAQEIRSTSTNEMVFEKSFVIDTIKSDSRLLVAGNHQTKIYLNDRRVMICKANEAQHLLIASYLKEGENQLKVTCRKHYKKLSFKAALLSGDRVISTDSSWGGIPVAKPALSKLWTDEGRHLPARYLRKEFELNKPIESAVLHLATGGIHEIWINGERVSDEVLAPGFSDFRHRIPSVSHDVTTQLQSGKNAIGVVLGNGRYYAPRRLLPAETMSMGAPVLRAHLKITHPDGTITVLVSNTDWKATDRGPIRANNEYDGEEYDARMEFNQWTLSDYNAQNWVPAVTMPKPSGQCRSTHSEPTKILGTRSAVEIVEIRPNVWRFDFGENLTGWTALSVAGERGTQITLRHAQRLNQDGSLDARNLRSALATNHYTLKGDPNGEAWEPRFTYHGFRWVEVTGLTSKPGANTLKAKMIGNNVSESATFVSSDPTLNQIIENCRRTIRSNYVSVPLDCADRDERQGWQGDRGAESWSETNLFDIAAIYTRWLEEIRYSQRPNGAVSDVSPAFWKFYSGSAVWPTVQTMGTLTMHLKYGDRRILEKHYAGNVAWVNFLLKRTGRNGLLQNGSYGDWCPPPTNLSLVHAVNPLRISDKAFVENAYLALQLKLMAESAEILGHDPRAWIAAREKIRLAIIKKWWHVDHFSNGTQASFALGHSFDLVPEGSQAVFREALAKRIESEKGRIGTGNIGIQWIHTTLDELLGPDVPLKMAIQKTYPGYGYMIDQGATTIWELWNGNTAAPSMNSANHIMMVGDFPRWCFEHLAGIKARKDGPGYARFTIAPSIPKTIKHVSASQNTIRGRVESNWKIDGGNMFWEVRIPANTKAELHFPLSAGKQIFESGKLVDITQVRTIRDQKVLWFESGKYRFELR